MTENLATPDSQIIVMPTPQAPTTVEPQRAGRLTRRTILDLNAHEFDRLQFMAKVYAASTFNSKTAQSEGDFFLIMMKGLELGISPMAAVDTINIISGKPVLDAKGMLALVKSSGLLEDIQIDSSVERCIVTVKRIGNTEQIVSFTMEDAKRFKTYEKGNWIPLSDKANWKSQPVVMLKWRAITSAMREVFPDVISGLYTPEELDGDTIVNDDGSMEIISTPALPASTNDKPAQNKVTQFPESGKQAAKTIEEATPKAWHEDVEALKKFLGTCRENGWIQGDTIGKLKQSFEQLVVKKINEFETSQAAMDFAEAEVKGMKEKYDRSKDEPTETPTTRQKGTTERWDTLEAINKIVEWSKKHGYGDNEPALLRMLGIPDWTAFNSGREACDEIEKVAKDKKASEPIGEKLSEEALDELYAWAEASFDFSEEKLNEAIDLSKFQTVGVAKTMIKGKAKDNKWPVVVEKVTYAVKTVDGTEKKYLSFQTVLGEMRYYPGRTEFAMLVGEEYANAGDILNLPVNKSKDIEPLLLTWKAAENYLQVVDAMPLLERELA